MPAAPNKLGETQLLMSYCGTGSRHIL